MFIKGFKDRTQAGKLLAKPLESYAHNPDAIVLGLPRGGVPVAFAVAQELGLPLDILLVRKLGVPGHEELAMGAIASNGEIVLAQDIVQMLGITDDTIQHAARREAAEIERREQLYRPGQPPLHLKDRVVILVDDGLATGSTMLAAVQAARAQNPARIVVAVPVGAGETCEKLKSHADEVVCLRAPEPFYAVGMWYENFAQTPDEEVIQLLDATRQEHGLPPAPGPGAPDANRQSPRHSP